MDQPLEPFRIKVVERLGRVEPSERRRLLEEGGYNLFRIPAAAITIDLLTDSGTGAMSDRQWAALMSGDESYAGSRSFAEFETVVRRITGFRHVIPTHQGRAAEHILFSVALRPGDVVPSNTHFDTTRANIEHTGAIALDCLVEEGLDPTLEAPFKGDMSLARLEAAFAKYGRERIPLVMLTVTNNSGGGQPVSLQNIRRVGEYCRRQRVPLILDACRFAENAWFIKQREPACAEMGIEQIAHAMFECAAGCTMSAKKDAIVNIGGFLCLQDDELAQAATNMLILREGFPTYGGLAGRDLAAIAVGLEEGMDEEYLSYRIGQVAYLGDCLREQGVPILRPVGGHAAYVDARSALPHIPPAQFPGQVFAAALYLEAGVRGVEIGSLMFEHLDPDSGRKVHPAMELVRLAVPRRVYTSGQLAYVAEACGRVVRAGRRLRGLEIVWEPPALRHFTARLRPVGGGPLLAETT